MEPTPEMTEALEAARKMQAEARRVTRTFEDKDPMLARQINDAAARTVHNLEMAIRCWEQMSEEDLDDGGAESWKA
jgi:hypothetical protein